MENAVDTATVTGRQVKIGLAVASLLMIAVGLLMGLTPRSTESTYGTEMKCGSHWVPSNTYRADCLVYGVPGPTGTLALFFTFFGGTVLLGTGAAAAAAPTSPTSGRQSS